eukprot:CAMPEP_0197313376 /NCGR_PEP_ID=MMETSP0891-20130614/27179_1 /TAXON_ID=44058 ORGANISM="Aureoumbra lagunensis, Strain CCMP1510" /NCGR_SAMPLE_ID=MMETSP0891 /ASSEMBLY_ACC=CAM_ASM_000534 /LENGTH=314 /DNA_ID=CAMNT_0042801169 /DNA_START=46 /DNA_END=990 /DNA_ORIENTATION=-
MIGSEVSTPEIKRKERSPESEENLADEEIRTEKVSTYVSSPPSARSTIRYAPRVSFAAQVEAWQRQQKQQETKLQFKKRQDFQKPRGHKDDSSDSSLYDSDIDDSSSSATLDLIGTIFCTSGRYGQGVTYDEVMLNSRPHPTYDDEDEEDTSREKTPTKWRSVNVSSENKQSGSLLDEYDDVDTADSCQIETKKKKDNQVLTSNGGDIQIPTSPYAASIIPSQHLAKLTLARPRLSRRSHSFNTNATAITDKENRRHKGKFLSPPPRLISAPVVPSGPATKALPSHDDQLSISSDVYPTTGGHLHKEKNISVVV